MKNIDLSTLAPEIVLRLNKIGGPTKPFIHLSIADEISLFRWKDDSLDLMLRRFLICAMSMGDPGRSVRMNIVEKSMMKGLETFFAFSAPRWIHCSIVFEAPSRFETSAKSVLDGLGYQCFEWIGNENSVDQLGAYCKGSGRQPELVLYLSHRKSSIQCDLIIPVIEQDDDVSSNRGTAVPFKSVGISDTSSCDT